MLLFKEQQQLLPRNQQRSFNTMNKREKYRQEIRQTSLKARFQQIRQQLMQELHSDSLKSILRGLGQDFNEERFDAMVELLEGNYDSVAFNDSIMQNGLDEPLANVLLNHDDRLTLDQRTRILTALCHLTFYSPKAIEKLMDKVDFFDHMRRKMEQLNMERTEDLLHFNQSLCLLMNIASDINRDFNFFLAQSDISLVINRQLAKTIVLARESNDQYYRDLVSQARNLSLRVYKNVVQELKSGIDKAAKLVGSVLQDEENLLHYPSRTFQFLSMAMDNDHFWTFFMQLPDISDIIVQICQAFDTIQSRCYNPPFLNDRSDKLTPQEKQNFYGIVEFLNQLYYEDEDHQISFDIMVENALNGFMLGEFIIAAHAENKKNYLIQAIRLIRNISTIYDVTAEQLIIVRPAEDPLELLKIITDPILLTGKKTNQFCLFIILNLIKKDHHFLPRLMEMRILDKLLDVLKQVENQDISTESNKLAIQLCTDLLKAAKEEGDDERILKIMGQKGLIDVIEHILSHRDRGLYVLAEEFMEIMSEIGKRQGHD